MRRAVLFVALLATACAETQEQKERAANNAVNEAVAASELAVHSAANSSASQLKLLPPSDPIESVHFAATYPKGRWMFGSPLPGLNIHPCNEEVCIAALNAEPFFIMIRTESDAHHPELTIVVENCAIYSASYANLPGDAHELDKAIRTQLAQNLSFLSRACKASPPEIPKLGTALLVEAAR